MKTALIALLLCSNVAAAASLRLLDDRRATLTDQLVLLENEGRPTHQASLGLLIGGGTALVVGGAALVGGLFWISGTRGSSEGETILALLGGGLLSIVGIAAMVAGAVLMIVSLVKFFVTLSQRATHDAELKEVRDGLDALDREPMPREPSTSGRKTIPAGFVVARF